MNDQISLFDTVSKPPRSSYSYATSLPCHKEVQSNGTAAIQETRVLDAIKGGCETLLQISEKTSILQAIVSARANGLVKKGIIQYSGHVVYKSRLRKRIIISKP